MFQQPDYLKNAHPWTSVTEPNPWILLPMTLHGNRRKSFGHKADGVFGRDRDSEVNLMPPELLTVQSFGRTIIFFT